jgi:hypothetical protein
MFRTCHGLEIQKYSISMYIFEPVWYGKTQAGAILFLLQRYYFPGDQLCIKIRLTRRFLAASRAIVRYFLGKLKKIV